MIHAFALTGPTASGKTALAVELAKVTNGEVVSCDSMQVYKRMDIGTAKPTQDEMQGIVHHMLDVAEPDEDFSVSRYCEMATPILDDILVRGKTAIIAGGTGLYMDSLIKGNDFAPYPATGRRQELEALAAEKGIEAVIDKLREVDPESAERLHPSDQKRIIRAMEVYLETGISITEHNRRCAGMGQMPLPHLFVVIEDYDDLCNIIKCHTISGNVEGNNDIVAFGLSCAVVIYKKYSLNNRCV